MRRLALAIGVVALAAAGIAFALRPPALAPLPEGSASAALLAPGPWQVGERREALQDPSRRTEANGDFEGMDGRDLPTRLWYPADAGGVAPGRHPVLVWSHGLFGNSGEPAYLAEHLASHGWIVAAADFPLTSQSAPGGPTVFDVVNQPGDVSFLIDTLLGWDAEPEHPFAGRVDAERIAVAGLSLGGMTTTLAAFHPRWRDPRVKAAISVAGPLQFLGPRFFTHASLPFLMIAGDIDAMIPYDTNARPVLERVPGARLVSVAGASHTGFADQARWLGWLDNADAFGCWFIKGRTPEDTRDTGFYDRLGSEDEGVLRTMDDRLCKQSPLPAAIPPPAQQRVVTLAARAFLESVMNPQAGERARYADYLDATLAGELGGVRVERAAPR